jgi:enamine deaminase RidA (YjgF/YER057c/UK114 family)
MNKKIKISSGAKWEDIVGYSRIVRTGSRVIVNGTTAINDKGELVGRSDVYAQTKFILQKIIGYLEQAGAKPEDVIRNRIYITDISRWEEAGMAHAELFGKIKPCCTMIEIKGLIDPDMLVEIETEAVID